MLHRPFLYLYGPNALNYGGLGTTIGHEFMHAFDVRNTIPSFWHTESIKHEYTDRAICLRRSHKSVLSLSLQEDILNDTTDSENLADFVGAKVAYAAYSSLPRNFKSGTIAGLNVSSEQLFFVSRCLKFCAQLIRSTERYAPYHSRCIVPLMNMPEFSSAYGCPAGTPMNPRNKCKFW
ncbi:neprilysin-1-like [Rhipicephalus microplus]|uniref:neprilysin-1-like n=1 Tax=Rhipicephalus microplus TaxID=6941 RepID=UPI003F6D6ED8